MSVEWIRGEGYYANSYFCEGILIDAGVYPMAFEKYKDKTDTIIITHCHYDHIAHIKEAKSMCGAFICIHEYDAQGLCDDIRSLSPMFSERSPGVCPDRLLKEGDVVGPFEVVHTPGHSKGSVCLYDRKTKDLISGDTVFSDGSFGRTDFQSGSSEDMLNSLKKLEKLEVRGIYPGHGIPAMNSGSEIIKRALKTAELY
jgi:hydroxyacylglutathione hydrolase